MVALVIVFAVVFAVAFLASFSIIMDEVSAEIGQEEISFEEYVPHNEIPEGNEEYDWGHNIRNYMEEEV